jgi:hypothetical protein
MARRTDAGPKEAVTGVAWPHGSSLLLLAAGAVGLLLVLGVLIALA